jgi:hypothetical protein
VSAPGYKEWVYTDAANPSWLVLRLGSGEKKVLDIELERAPTDATDKVVACHDGLREHWPMPSLHTSLKDCPASVYCFVKLDRLC